MTEATTEVTLPYSDALPGAVIAEEPGLDGTSLIVAVEQLPALARLMRDAGG